jgi:hypothetical protein
MKVAVHRPDYYEPTLMHSFIQLTVTESLQLEIIFFFFDKYRKMFKKLDLDYNFFTTQFIYNKPYFEKIDKFLFQMPCKVEVNGTEIQFGQQVAF